MAKQTEYLTEAQMSMLCSLAHMPQEQDGFSGQTITNLYGQRLIIIEARGGWSNVIKISSKGRDRIDGIIGAYRDSFGVEKIEELETCLRKSRGEVQALKRRVKRLIV